MDRDLVGVWAAARAHRLGLRPLSRPWAPDDLPAPNPQWMAERQRLHDAWFRDCRVMDASQLNELGEERRWFSEAEVADLWGASTGGFMALNHVYVHVPFCKSICSFCNYERLKPSSPDLLEDWLDGVLASLRILGPRVADRTFHSLYIGGGTPSVLPAKLLGPLLEGLDTHINWARRNTRYFESDPAIMSDARLDLLVKHGFSHISFGVQTLDADNNVDHNRGAQDAELVGRRFREYHDRGLKVSCDFLFGLANTDVDQIIDEVDRVLTEHRPMWVDTYLVSPTADYIDSHFDGDTQKFWDHLDTFQHRAPVELERLGRKHGYEMATKVGHGWSLNRRGWQFDSVFGNVAYTQSAHEQKGRPIDLLGLGQSARSHIWGQGALEYHRVDGEVRYLGRTFEPSEEGRHWLVMVLRDRNRANRSTYARLFGRDLLTDFASAQAAWQALGVVTRDASGLSLVPQDRLERLRTLLWLLPEDALEREIARAQGRPWDAGSLRNALPQTLLGFTVKVGGARVWLDDLEVRLVPPLSEGERMRMVLMSAPADPAPVKKALGALRKLIPQGPS